MAISIISCQSDNKTDENSTQTENAAKIENEDQFEQKMADIDNATDLKLINSLAYNNNEGSRIDAIAYLDKNDQEVKIEENFADVKTGNYGKYAYYVENGKKFATKEVYYDNQLSTPSFVERVSFYDEKGKVMFTKERLASFEDELEKAAFQIRTPKDCSIDRAMRVLNQEGEFTTTFQGFASAGNLTYLLVGEDTKDGYASSLAVQYEEGDIKTLLKSERAYIGTPLEVQHEVMVDERGLKFQVLLAVEIK
jgi:hypothetical protein